MRSVGSPTYGVEDPSQATYAAQSGWGKLFELAEQHQLPMGGRERLAGYRSGTPSPSGAGMGGPEVDAFEVGSDRHNLLLEILHGRPGRKSCRSCIACKPNSSKAGKLQARKDTRTVVPMTGEVDARPHPHSSVSKDTTTSWGRSPSSVGNPSPADSKASAEPASSPMESEFSFLTSVASASVPESTPRTALSAIDAALSTLQALST